MDPFGGSEITEDGNFIIPDTSEATAGFTTTYTQSQEIYEAPFFFFDPGSLVLNASVPNGGTVYVYFRFGQSTDINPLNDYVTDPIPIGGNLASDFSITIPAKGSIYLTLSQCI